MSETRIVAGGVVIWTGLSAWRALAAHYSLWTNAYDLSIFDYALWNSLHGHFGFVPFLSQSIFSQHFMPVLILMLPLYAFLQSPVCLILIQLVASGGAVWLLYRYQQQVGLSGACAMALLVAFALSRRSHGAFTSYFYPESLQALLTFAMLLAWTAGRWGWYAACAIVLLATKEDAALYVGAFALVQWWLSPDRRRAALATAAGCGLWLVVALGAAIPASRLHDGLSSANPFVEGRFASGNGKVEASTIGGRVVSGRSATSVFNLLASSGFVAVAGPQWLLSTVPGVVLSLAAKSGTQQSTLNAHYAWGVLPWLFVAAVHGAKRFSQRAPRMAVAWAVLLVAGTLIDSPFVRYLGSTRFDPEARQVLAQLRTVQGRAMAVQPNLVPHMAHSNAITTVMDSGPSNEVADLVLLTGVGDPWPLSADDVSALIRRYQSDPRYEAILTGPLYSFHRLGR